MFFVFVSEGLSDRVPRFVRDDGCDVLCGNNNRFPIIVTPPRAVICRSLIVHHSLIITHHSSFIIHHSSSIIHHSLIIHHPSSIIP